MSYSVVELITGLQGSGKTLFALKRVQERALSENRAVYYSGISLNADKLPNWVDLDAGITLDDGTELKGAKDWHKLPPGSIMVIDECQTLFRKRSVGSVVPPYVSALETMRHNGHNLVLITQHPGLIDADVRRLTGCHFHVIRTFGLKKSAIFEFNRVVDDPSRPGNRRDSIARHDFFYPKEVFTWYHSAEVHTVKAGIPKKFFLLPLAIIGIVLCVWYFVHIMRGISSSDSKSSSAQATQSLSIRPVTDSPVDKNDPSKWYKDREPRIAGLPSTQPSYDEQTKPKRAPFPAACVQSKKQGCRCWSEQGTVLTVAAGICEQIVKNGIYDDFRDDRSIQNQPQQLSSPQEVVRVAAADVAKTLPAVEAPVSAYGLIRDAGQYPGPKRPQ